MAYEQSMDTLASGQLQAAHANANVGSSMLSQHDAILAQALAKYQRDDANENLFRDRFQNLWWPVEQSNAALMTEMANDPNWQGIMSAAAEDAQGALAYNQEMRDLYSGYFNTATGYSTDEMQRAKEFDEELAGTRATYEPLDAKVASGAEAELEEEQFMRDTYNPLYTSVVEDSQRDYGEDYARIAGTEQRRAQALQDEELTRDASRLGLDPSRLLNQKAKSSIANAANTAAATTNARLQGDQERFQNMISAIGTREDVSSANRSYAVNRMNQATKAPSTVATTAASAGAGTMNNSLGSNILSQFNPLTTNSWATTAGQAYQPKATVPQYSYLAGNSLQALGQYSDALTAAGSNMTSSYKANQDQNSSTMSDIGSGLGMLAGAAKTGASIYGMF